jgi:hypothetical protein
MEKETGESWFQAEDNMIDKTFISYREGFTYLPRNWQGKQGGTTPVFPKTIIFSPYRGTVPLETWTVPLIQR